MEPQAMMIQANISSFEGQDVDGTGVEYWAGGDPEPD